MDRNEIQHDPRHLGVPSGASKMISKPMVHLAKNRVPILCQDLYYLQMDRNGFPPKPRHQGVASGASKMISEPMVRLAQIVQLSCPDTNTVSKRTVTRFDMTHVTKQFHQGCPKWVLSLWYVWCKPHSYLSSTLTPSPNGPKQDSTWPTSPRSSIGCVQTDFRAYGMFGTNRAPVLHQD
jgi:hypothetical protein